MKNAMEATNHSLQVHCCWLSAASSFVKCALTSSMARARCEMTFLIDLSSSANLKEAKSTRHARIVSCECLLRHLPTGVMQSCVTHV